MNQISADKIHYLRIPKGQGGRAEMVRMVYVLAGKPYVDALWSRAETAQAVGGKNPFKQFPFVETPSGRHVYQTLAIMHHAAHGTPAWPSDPTRLTDALAVAVGAYDLYQAFGAFAADDLVAKKRFEEKRAPQYIRGLGEIYATRSFAAGDVPTFADCIVHEAVAWCVRRNEASRTLFEANAALGAFFDRFRALPAIREFMARQAAAREKDDSV
ncbi:MAG TPA: glutathione S-transferase family protein [Polyangiaceae bacterium]